MSIHGNRGFTGILRLALLSGVSTLGLYALTTPAWAQENTEAEAAEGSTIVVTGVRASLQRAMDIKRNADGVVDSISAEDIGKYPDTNLAESVQRIPGVSINRVNGEGSEVTVRGFGPGFNLVTLNGRTMPTANIAVVGVDGGDTAGGGSRNFDFGTLASDGITGFDVYKTARADVPSGGIGATLNVKTLRPLDNRAGLTGSASAKALYGENIIEGDDLTPELSGALSWASADKMFGVSVFGAFTERHIATRQATSNAWNVREISSFLGANDLVRPTTTITGAPPAGTLIAFPNDSRYGYSETQTERTNLQATAQFRPFDGLTLTADALLVKNEAVEQRSEQTNWFNRPFNQVSFTPGNIYTATFLQENINGTKDVGFEQQLRAIDDQLESFGINAEYDVTDRLRITFDAHTSKGEAKPGNSNGTTSTVISIGAPVIAAHSVDYSGDVPVQRYTVDDDNINDEGVLRGNANGRLDAGDLGSQVGRTWTRSQTHEIDEFRVAATYDLNEWLSFDAGAGMRKSTLTTTAGETYQALGDWGIGDPGDIEQYAPGLIETYCLSCRFKDFSIGQADIAFRANAVDLYTRVAAGYNTSIPIASVSTNTIDEDVTSFYASGTIDRKFFGYGTRINAGIRYEKTEITANAAQSIPTAIVWTADNDQATQFGAISNLPTVDAEYDHWLPNLDIAVDVTEDIKARASFSKTIARPAFGNMYSTTTTGTPPRPTLFGQNPSGDKGNPALLPLESTNQDISVEYYFAPTSYVSVGFFNKDVENFVGTGIFPQNLFGLRDPTSGAAGSRSGTAVTLLNGINAGLSDVNLFTMTALLIKNNGDQAAATAEYQANTTNGALNQAFVDSVLRQYDITANANDPLYTFLVRSPINNRTANLNGFEIGFQHFFGETGFGVAGSYTTVEGDVAFDNAAAVGTDQFALLGLSDTYNVTLIYDNYGLSGRLSYNWRDEFLSGTNRDAPSNNPTYTAPFGVLDVALNYELTDNIQLTFEGLNLTRESLRQYGRDERQLYYAQELDRRFQFGARYKF